jgi:hypothetical protein
MTAPRTHGARSQAQVTRLAGYCKQSLLQRLGIKQADLPPVDRFLLDKWARIEAEVQLIDLYVADRGGPLDEHGEPWSFTKTLYAARNSASRLLTKLEPRLLAVAAAKQGRGGSELDRYLRDTYGEGKAKP